MIDVDLVLVDLDERTAFCSDGVTRSIELYDARGQPTEDPDEAITGSVKLNNGQAILFDLTEPEISLH